jgi:LPXTG-motif cell wall-anchored protein
MYIVQTMLASGTGDGNQTFWMVMLMIVLLSSGIGLWTLVRRKAGQTNSQDESSDYSVAFQTATRQHTKADFPQESFGNSAPEIARAAKLFNHPSKNPSRRKLADLESGLELLEQPFLAGVVSNTGSRSKLDIQMRKIAFMELARREKLGDIASKVLKVYAKNQENLFGKTIQCQAIRQLSVRTKNEKYEPVAAT